MTLEQKIENLIKLAIHKKLTKQAIFNYKTAIGMLNSRGGRERYIAFATRQIKCLDQQERENNE